MFLLSLFDVSADEPLHGFIDVPTDKVETCMSPSLFIFSLFASFSLLSSPLLSISLFFLTSLKGIKELHEKEIVHNSDSYYLYVVVKSPKKVQEYVREGREGRER